MTVSAPIVSPSSPSNAITSSIVPTAPEASNSVHHSANRSLVLTRDRTSSNRSLNVAGAFGIAI